MNRILASLGLTLAIAVPVKAQIADYANHFGEVGSDFGFNVCQTLRSSPGMRLERAFDLTMSSFGDVEKSMIEYVLDAPQ